MSRDNDVDEWRRLAGAWLDRLRSEGDTPPPQRRDPSELILITYRKLKDGEPFHTQDMGWRMTADIPYSQIVERQRARPGRDDEESQLHLEFDALAVRQICYVFLACWRLSIEIELKRALVGVHDALELNKPNKVDRLLRGHDIAALWQRFRDIAPVFESELRAVASANGIDPSGVGYMVDVGSQQPAVDLIVSIDPDGQSLRYREDLSENRNMSSFAQVDVAATHVKFLLLPPPGLTEPVDEGNRIHEQPQGGLTTPRPRPTQRIIESAQVIPAHLVQAGSRTAAGVHSQILSAASPSWTTRTLPQIRTGPGCRT